MPLSIFQSLRRTLTISLYTFLSLLPSPFHDVTRLRVLLLLLQRVSNASARGRRGLFPRKETGHLLFPYSDMKRHFYFCRPPLDRRRRRYISTVFKTLSREYQCHVRERGSRARGSRRLTIWISHVPSRNLSPVSPSHPLALCNSSFLQFSVFLF